MAKDTIPTKRQLGALAAENGVSALLLAGVKGLRRWDDLYEVSEDELAAAIREFQNVKLGA